MAWMLRALLLLLLLGSADVMADLRDFYSHYYQVHTDLEPGLAQDLARRLDAMHEEYTRRLMQFDVKPDLRPVDAYLFTSQADYLRFAGAGMKSTGGVYIPSRNALAAFHDGQGRDSLRRTLQHEAFHQFAANTVRYPLPMWLNEGMAQYFEEGFWTGDGFTLGQAPPRRVRQLQSDITAGRLIDFETFMRMGPEEWAAGLGKRFVTRGATQYNQAWAMVHFLVNAADASGQPRFRSRLIDMLRLIHNGYSSEQAFAQAFGGNYKTFRDRFNEWAKTLSPTTEATYIEQQDVLADMLVAMHSYGKHFKSMTEFQKAVAASKLSIQYSSGHIRWSTSPEPGPYFSRTDGSPFTPEELYLETRRSSPLPDIVCRCLPNTILRTRFYQSGGKIEHELLFEPLSVPAPLASPLRRANRP